MPKITIRMHGVQKLDRITWIVNNGLNLWLGIKHTRGCKRFQQGFRAAIDLSMKGQTFNLVAPENPLS